jgi:hypothetical protein
VGEVRTLERHLLRWRTRRGHGTARRYLDDFATALAPQGWRFVMFYRRGRRGYLCLCGDAETAAAQVDRPLKHRLFPATW